MKRESIDNRQSWIAGFNPVGQRAILLDNRPIPTWRQGFAQAELGSLRIRAALQDLHH
jgi:hypothetical protein